MIMHGAVITNASRRLLAGVTLATLALGCSKDDPAQAGDPLCPGEAGVGLRVEGRAEPLDVCIGDNSVDALLTSSSHYDVSAQVTVDDGTAFQLRMVFTHRPDAPVTLRLVNSITEATNDPDAVYVYYEEFPDGGTPIETNVLLSGKFRLTFNDDTVAAGTMENIGMDMANVLTGAPAGTRNIAEGFFSVSVGPSAAADVSAR